MIIVCFVVPEDAQNKQNVSPIPAPTGMQVQSQLFHRVMMNLCTCCTFCAPKNCSDHVRVSA